MYATLFMCIVYSTITTKSSQIIYFLVLREILYHFGTIPINSAGSLTRDMPAEILVRQITTVPHCHIRKKKNFKFALEKNFRHLGVKIIVNDRS